MYYRWKPYVSVAERRRKAMREVARRNKQGETATPVTIAGRTIAQTFWGRAWCENLERYSDYANRLPRGKSYVRNGSVIDLKIAAGSVHALVSGSSLYTVKVAITAVPKARWSAIRAACAGAIDSLIELLQGRFSTGVMQRLCKPEEGLFPAPKEIKFDCSCPDWASMCKHVAATLYGVGARLDQSPELLFLLRKVDHTELIADAGTGLAAATPAVDAGRQLADSDLGALFGIEMADAAPAPARSPRKSAAKSAGSRSARVATANRRAAPAVPARPRAKAAGRSKSSRPVPKSPAAPKKKPAARAPGRKSVAKGGSIEPNSTRAPPRTAARVLGRRKP
jgi:uncharacterized Zn finger protein